MYETVKVKPGLLWRPQDVEYGSAVEYLPRRAANGEGNQPKKKKQNSHQAEMMNHSPDVYGNQMWKAMKSNMNRKSIALLHTINKYIDTEAKTAYYL